MQLKKLFTLLAFVGIAATTFAQVTFTAVGGKDGYTGEGYSNLFDGTSKKWCTNATDAYFIFEASEAITLTGYAMRTGSDGETDNLNRNPSSWTIYGSNAENNHGQNGSWTQIQQVTGNEDMDSKQQKTFYFSIDDNYTPYKYYKVTIDAVRSGSNVQISEFIPSYWERVVTTGIDGADAWDGDDWHRAVDGDLTTKRHMWPWDDRNYVIIDAGHPVVLKTYMLATGNDTKSGDSGKGYYGRNPKGWKFYGNNSGTYGTGMEDNTGWTEIVSVSNTPLPFEDSYPTYFNVEGTPDAYRYYKFVVTDVVEWGMYQIGEIALNPHEEHTASSTYSFAGGGTNQQIELCDVCNAVCYRGGYKEFRLVDGKPFSVFVNGWGGNGVFYYTRSVSSPMGTVCLPYSMSVDGKDATYYTLAYYNSAADALVFDQVTGTLNQRTPALYVLTDPADTSLNLNATGAAFGVTPSDNVTVNDRESDGWAMVGTIKSGTASESSNSIYYVKDGGFKRCNVNITYKPYRAYITGPAGGSSVKAFGIADDMEDAIKSIMSTENGEIQLYDLSGRKVSKVRNGEIYIINGRKVMFNK